MGTKDELLLRIAALEAENRALHRRLASVRKEGASVRAQPVELARALAEGGPLQRSEQLEALFELLPVGIAIAYGADCHEIRANAALLGMLGGSGAQNEISKSGPNRANLPFRVFLDGVEASPEDLPLQRSAREGIAIDDSRCEIHRDDGRTVVLQGIVRPLLGHAGSRLGSVGAFFDVTGREMEVTRLQALLAHLRVLSGFIRICACCKRIGDDADNWQPLERYVTDHSDAQFSHGLCPDCFRRAMSELAIFQRPPEEL